MRRNNNFNRNRDRDPNWGKNGLTVEVLEMVILTLHYVNLKRRCKKQVLSQELRERPLCKVSEKRKKAKAAGRARWLKKQAKQKADWGN